MFIPFNFNGMLDYLCSLAKRERLYSEIKQGNFSPAAAKKDMSNFVKLFQRGVDDIDSTSDRQVQLMVKLALRMKNERFKR